MESRLTNDQVLGAIRAQFGEVIGEEQHTTDGILNVFVEPATVHDVVVWLYNHSEFKVQFLTNITGIHIPENDTEKQLMVVYHLHSLQNNFRLRLKAYLSIDNPSIATITDVYSASNWLERETYDFFGIIFEGHPNLIRILNEDSMDYFPMRKQYHLEDETRQDKDNRFFGR